MPRTLCSYNQASFLLPTAGGACQLQVSLLFSITLNPSLIYAIAPEFVVWGLTTTSDRRDGYAKPRDRELLHWVAGAPWGSPRAGVFACCHHCLSIRFIGNPRYFRHRKPEVKDESLEKRRNCRPESIRGVYFC